MIFFLKEIMILSQTFIDKSIIRINILTTANMSDESKQGEGGVMSSFEATNEFFFSVFLVFEKPGLSKL